MAGMRVLNELTKGSEFPWMTDTYIWQDDAACQQMPSEMWEVASEGDPIAEGLEAVEIRSLNVANLTSAQKICHSCPVRQECEDSASDWDTAWTMRAGKWPSKIKAPNKAELGLVAIKRRTENAIEQHRIDLLGLERTCPRGHVGRFTHAGKYGVVCGVCLDEGLSADDQGSYSWCINGHEEWKVRNNGRRECVACVRMRKFRKRRPEEAARLAA